MHAIIRRYRVRLGTVGQAIRFAEKRFLPLIRSIPGFRAYYLLDAGTDSLASVGVFETKEGADAALQLSQDWFGDEWPFFRPLPPEVVAGEVLAHAAADGRAAADRRRLPDRRRAAMLVAGSGTERRSGIERRASAEVQANRHAATAWSAAG